MSLFPPSRLQRTLTLLGVLIASVLVLLGAAVFAQWAALMNIKAAGDEHLSLYNAYLQSELDKIALLSRLVCTNPSVSDLLLAPNDRTRDRVNRAIEEFSQASGAAKIYVMDRRGTVAASSNWHDPDSLVGETLAEHPFWQLALRDAPVQFVAFGSSAGKLGYYASCPIRWHNQRIGNTVVRQDTDDLARAWRHGGASLMVTDQNGVIFLSTEGHQLLHVVRPMSDSTRAQLRATRQYLDRAFPPLSMRAVWTLGSDTMVAALPADGSKHMGSEKYLLVQTRVLAGTDWTIYVVSDLRRLDHWVMVAVGLAGAVLSLILVVAFYFYKRRQHLRQLLENSIRDPLTRLYTRLYMQDAVSGLEAWQDREPQMAVALALFDVDHFKQVNDAHGHRAGDEVLRAIGQVILDEAREGDIPVRYGGEEVAVFLRVHDIQEAVRFAERVRAHAQQLRFMWARKEVHVTVSAGVALRTPGEPLESLIERSDRRLYEAKDAGRNCIRFDAPQVEPHSELR